MKLNKEDSLIWLEQTEHNLEVSVSNLRSGFYFDSRICSIKLSIR